MKKRPNTRTIPPTTNESTYVSSLEIAKRYGVSSRYILQLANEGKIPCLRLGKKCVRFDIEAVMEALEGKDT